MRQSLKPQDETLKYRAAGGKHIEKTNLNNFRQAVGCLFFLCLTDGSRFLHPPFGRGFASPEHKIYLFGQYCQFKRKCLYLHFNYTKE
jgi:hypothetical protein